MNLEELRGDILTVLGRFGVNDINNEILFQGLRLGLLDVSFAAQPVEASVTVTVDGYEQSLASVTDLLMLVSVAYPWLDDSEFFDARVTSYENVSRETIRLPSYAVAGDVIRLRYLRWYQVAGLDGASATTVLDAYRDVLAMFSAAHVLWIRAHREDTVKGGVDLDAVARHSQGLKDEATDKMAMLRPAEGVWNWQEVGL
jgi:hypothetical protein